MEGLSIVETAELEARLNSLLAKLDKQFFNVTPILKDINILRNEANIIFLELDKRYSLEAKKNER